MSALVFAVADLEVLIAGISGLRQSAWVMIIITRYYILKASLQRLRTGSSCRGIHCNVSAGK
jgi:hypothetical protein